ADFSTKKNQIFIEDLGFPDALAWYLEGAIPSGNRVYRMMRFISTYLMRAIGLIGDNRIAHHLNHITGRGMTVRLLPYLGMGSDAADGILRLNRKGNLDINWDNRNSLEMFKEMEDALRKLSKGIGGKYITSPLWLWPAKKLLTAHPLGGCRMSDDVENGVVDQYGRAWGYKGLYIADGSIVPTALSVNPSMTISALSERIAEFIIEHEKK
ncbi:MAG: GMC family oxidoreductase, partial [Nitrospirae bacterium]